MKFSCIIFFLSISQIESKSLSLFDYGGIPSCPSVECALQNGLSFHEATQDAEPGDVVSFSSNTYNRFSTI